MITTKGRIEESAADLACFAAIESTAAGGADHDGRLHRGVVAAVKAELPEARLFVNQIGLGSVASRDRMMRAGAGRLGAGFG